METTAIVRGVRLSAQKGRLVADLIRGQQVGRALSILEFTQKALPASSASASKAPLPMPNIISALTSTPLVVTKIHVERLLRSAVSALAPRAAVRVSTSRRATSTSPSLTANNKRQVNYHGSEN